MLDLVKFTWRNGNGYWIPVAWMTVPSDATNTRAEEFLDAMLAVTA